MREVKYDINAEKPLSPIGPHIKMASTAKKTGHGSCTQQKYNDIKAIHFYYSVWDDAKLFKLLPDFPFD